MRIDIIVVYVQRYQYGHEVDFVPPITGIHPRLTRILGKAERILLGEGPVKKSFAKTR